MQLVFDDAKDHGVILDVGNSWKLILNESGFWENQTLGALRANKGWLDHEPGGTAGNRRLVGYATIGQSDVRMFQFDYFFVGTFSYYTSGTGTLFQEAVRTLMVPGQVTWWTD